MSWNREIGNVWAARVGREDLSTDDMAIMCHFARHKLQPMFAEVLESSPSVASRREAINFIIWDNMMAFWNTTGALGKGTRKGSSGISLQG